MKDYIDSLKDESKWGGTPYSARYIGSLVGDFHRTLLYGEVWLWLGDLEARKTAGWTCM